MRRHSMLCSQLFQAVDQPTHFWDVKVYYFHNCVYDELFDVGGSYQGKFNQVAGIECLRRFQKKYTHMVWINPSLRERMGRGFLAET